ncbi:hypothetical protein LB503_003924 [Fusarium chuoi]|nr:hypothetical protein LB503_003924 [Fusarium chuoi]
MRYPRIGFCDQTAFLWNGTIRDNILGFSLYDEKRYNSVIQATALSVDFAKLAQGDQTNVGSDGITLSGGQKQRVSLAPVSMQIQSCTFSNEYLDREAYFEGDTRPLYCVLIAFAFSHSLTTSSHSGTTLSRSKAASRNLLSKEVTSRVSAYVIQLAVKRATLRLKQKPQKNKLEHKWMHKAHQTGPQEPKSTSMTQTVQRGTRQFISTIS